MANIYKLLEICRWLRTTFLVKNTDKESNMKRWKENSTSISGEGLIQDIKSSKNFTEFYVVESEKFNKPKWCPVKLSPNLKRRDKVQFKFEIDSITKRVNFYSISKI